jgi:AmiR/NasT family two-component response regulator
MAGLGILFVCNRPHVCDHFRAVLAEMGHQVLAAPDVGQLAEVCRRSSPGFSFARDLILADANPTAGPAPEAVLAVAKEAGIPVVLLTDRHDHRLFQRIENESALMGYLIHPVTPDALGATLRIAVLRFAQFRAALGGP